MATDIEIDFLALLLEAQAAADAEPAPAPAPVPTPDPVRWICSKCQYITHHHHRTIPGGQWVPRRRAYAEDYHEGYCGFCDGYKTPRRIYRVG